MCTEGFTCVYTCATHAVSVTVETEDASGHLELELWATM